MSTPIVAVTMGDPAGIGPEIVARSLADVAPDAPLRPLAIGDAPVLRHAARICGLDVEVRPITSVEQARFEPGTLEVLDLAITGDDLAFGEVSADAGRSAVAAIETATRLALDGEVAGITTAPINKEAIWAAGSSHLGHTEMLGELTGTSRSGTMFVVDDLKIFFTTRHMSLREAIDRVTEDAVRHAIDESLTALRVLGHDAPRLAVAALNPHVGEGGKFGTEEIDAIGPACEAARAAGHNDVSGPVGADSVFHQGLQGRFDGVLSHFHDQGHIAAKTWDFEGAITVTIGLPILRTSVDHGTAFDIAGQGVASHRGLRAALAAAGRFAPYADRMRETYGA
ncbi:4-hydroxythreonine-4-phosphate dehydrogenase PdxA [Egibacter rhizosphaerae]|uniref:4-hydroxythreonine-4-phosphate dehydrogenase PdxA n=1 Tax=Egibacter rhizosphaerae TaxID=1670831 RepID=A0A411YKG3_9ACTN|nr:4-hydroxythreonine-4-phosphate dehydrogenase PdxA [Egibacter rhizosphaerae]QBI21685.1 4-hydroxythreonine-4-phosphate dehydrogenase PdxA [Egibacter rhizosphaerae]